MIYVTGDIHGKVLERFGRKHTSINFKENDYKIILGDFGVVWTDKYAKQTMHELYWMNNVSKGKFVVLLGNHDNWDWALSLPKVRTEIGTVRQCIYKNVIYDNIYIIADPSILDIEGKNFLCVPGAECHDIPDYFQDKYGHYHSTLPILSSEGSFMRLDGEKLELTETPSYFRIEGEDWWKDEKINTAALACEIHNISNNNIKIDYILSHDCPALFIHECNEIFSYITDYPTEGEEALESARKMLDFKHWYHGHLHMDKFTLNADNRITCLYNSIIKIEE